MSWFVDLAVGLVKTAWELRPTRPYWRWGHGYPQVEGVFTCDYCGRVDVFRQRVTNPPCPGPRRRK